MKKALAVIIIAVMLMSLCACGADKADPTVITIQQLLNEKGSFGGRTMTVTVTEIKNPALVLVKDAEGSTIDLFGIIVDGEFMSFEKAGIAVGSTIVLKNGIYSETKTDSVQIEDAELVSIK